MFAGCAILPGTVVVSVSFASDTYGDYRQALVDRRFERELEIARQKDDARRKEREAANARLAGGTHS